MFKWIKSFFQESDDIIPAEYLPIARDSRPGLICIHDLNKTPHQFKNWIKKVIESLKARDFLNEIQIWTPEVKSYGNCSLSDASRNIINLSCHIIDTQKRAGIKTPKLILTGYGNGARIASNIETILRVIRPKVEVLLISIEGYFGGSYYIECLKKYIPRMLLNYVYDPVIVEELSYNSQKSEQLNQAIDLRKNPPSSHRYFSYYHSGYSLYAIPDYFEAFRYEYLSILGTSTFRFILNHEPFIEDQSNKIYYFLRF